MFFVSFLGVRLSPLAASAAILPLYQLQITDKYGELAWETEILEENIPHCRFIHHKSHMTWPGIEPGTPRWECGDWPPELRQSLKCYHSAKRLGGYILHKQFSWRLYTNTILINYTTCRHTAFFIPLLLHVSCAKILSYLHRLQCASISHT
jgi:hypothetical protein